MKQCLPCEINCAVCSGPSSSECISCLPLYFKHQDAGCAQFCQDGFYDASPSPDHILFCAKSHPTCRQALGPLETQCTACYLESDLLSYPGICKCRLTDQYYDLGLEKCAYCSQECKTCEESPTKCLSCVQDRFFLESEN